MTVFQYNGSFFKSKRLSCLTRCIVRRLCPKIKFHGKIFVVHRNVVFRKNFVILCHILGERSHVTKFNPIFPLMFFHPIYQVEWVVYPFATKFCSPIRSNIGPNFGGGLNFVTCEQSFKLLSRLQN